MRLKGWINPLSFTANPDPTTEDVLAFLCPPETSSDIQSLVARYQELNNPPLGLAFVPSEPVILYKILWPLRQAKASYMIGNYLTVIALCGMVAEMVAILFWELAGPKLHALTKEDQNRLFCKTFESETELEQWFERQGQKKRVKLLLKPFQQIDEKTKESFDEIRNTRRKYLHFWSQDHDAVGVDAMRVYQRTESLAAIAIGVAGFQDGKVTLSDRLIGYLKRHHIMPI